MKTSESKGRELRIQRVIGAAWLLIACGGATSTSTSSPVVSRSDAPVERVARDEPARRLDDEEAARTLTQAMQVHVRARELAERCEDDGDEACTQARQLFAVAADTWRVLVEGRPDDAAGEWSFMLAQAMFWARRYEAAGDAAERYVALGEPEWRLQAARILLASREGALDGAGVRERTAPPRPQGDPPTVRELDVPTPIEQLVTARARFAEVMAERGDEDGIGRSLTLTNALMRYHYGQWERAQVALRAVFEGGCAGEAAWAGAATAWTALRDIALAQGRHDAVRALGDEASACDFGTEAPVCGPESEDPRCVARADRAAWHLLGARRFLQRADHARSADERRQWRVRAAETFLAALEVEGELDARGRLIALEEASSAFRAAGEAERAAAVDHRIVREIQPDRLDDADRSFALATLGLALHRELDAELAQLPPAGAATPTTRDAIAALAVRRARVVELARRLLAPELEHPELGQAREQARSALPEVLSALGRHAEASRAFSELAEATSDPAQRREAELRAVLALAGACGRALRPLQDFIAAQRGQEGADDAVVRALWQVVECQRPGTSAHVAALEEVARAGEAAHRLGPVAARRAAEATFLLVDRDMAGLARLRVRVPGGENIEAMNEALRAQLVGPIEQVSELVARFARVERYRIPRWSAAARYRSGLAFEALDRVTREATWDPPADLQSQRRTLSAGAFAQIRAIVEARAAEILATRAGLFRCDAARHYRGAIEIAGSTAADEEETRAARERLGSLEVPARCPPSR
ncbi:MAG: hypothetical protein KF901_23415 [Myxococcales bacterium]|nr:hypothetical protein [Myxococcales bacterium]